MVTVSDDARWISGPTYDYGEDDASYYRKHRNSRSTAFRRQS